jgi:hypothetical protein
MSYSISTLLTRNLHDVFGENDPARRRAAIDEIYTEDGVFYDPSKGVYRGRDEIDRVAGAIRAAHPDFDISQSRNPRSWVMAGGSSGYRAGPVRRQLMPGLTSLLPGTAGLPPQGIGDEDLARIRAPVGLSIGAKGPAEIAVSILAEIIKTSHREF